MSSKCSDVLADLKQFSIGFVSEAEFNQLLAGDTNVEYNYSYKLDGEPDRFRT